jgi:ectoine hydroxylase-related dioxygenase (phytanoyl-CoA dioxygenase family)
MVDGSELVGSVLGPQFKLSSLNARSANPQSASVQPFHIDMGLLPDSKGNAVCNCVWMLDDFTAENGALRVIPGSHHWGRKPQDVLADPYAPHPDEVLVTGRAGTVVVMNAHAWHGGTANRTPRERRALHSFFCRSDIPQQQYQKKLLRPETQAGLSAELRKLLALDDAMNDKLSSTGSGQSGFMR